MLEQNNVCVAKTAVTQIADIYFASDLLSAAVISWLPRNVILFKRGGKCSKGEGITDA